MKVSAIQTEFPYAPSSAEGFRERQVSRVSWFWLNSRCDRVGDRASHSHTPVTFHTHHKQDGCFRCYHPLPEGASARGTPARSRRALDARFRTRLPRDAREKKPYPRCVVVDHRSASRVWRAHDDDATHVTDPAPSLRFPRVFRLSSAARPPVSSAARLSRYARCDAHLGNYFGTHPGWFRGNRHAP